MKKLLFLLLSLSGVLLILWSCAAPSASNYPPATPSNPYPMNNVMNVLIDVTLSWGCSDPDGDSLTYDIYFGTSSNPPLVKSGHTGNSYNPGTLQYNMTYYWKIVATDGKGGETRGPVWKFTIESEGTPGSYICGAGGRKGLIILDVSDPTNPEIAGQVNIDDWVNEVFISGIYAYVANGENGLGAVNVSDPTDPRVIGHIDTAG